jgi:hypothetical protein
MSLLSNVAITALEFACLVAAQPRTPALRAVEPIEAVVTELLGAIHAGNIDRARELVSEQSRQYSPGGVALAPLRRAMPGFWNTRKSCSFYVRHIQVLTAESALVVGLWRCPSAPPPQDAGMFDWTMRLENGSWKVASWREGYVPSPHLQHAPVSGAIDGTDILTAAEREEGWRALFDGKSSNGWTTPAGDSKLPTGWRIADGDFITVADAGAERIGIRTTEEFTNFDLKFEWQVGANANSGCLYRLYTLDFVGGRPHPVAAAGLEYQIADDNGDPGARVDPRQRSGALYAVIPVKEPVAKAAGEWNDSRILVTRDRIEHWLNGVKTAEYAVDIPFASPILLQHHFSEVRFRKLRIKPLP